LPRASAGRAPQRRRRGRPGYECESAARRLQM